MPILWRYLVGQYVRVLLLSLGAFIGILLATRLDDIARFATIGGNGMLVIRFALLQVPYIFPLALPICCAIGATLLFQRLSGAGELTAMRASGLSFLHICTPVILVAGMLTVANFYIVSEVATRSHLKVKQLQMEAKSINPMTLLQKRGLLKQKGAYVDVLGTFRSGEYAEDVVLAIKNKNGNRLHVLLAESMQRDRDEVVGRRATVLSSIGSANPESFDHLIIENMREIGTPILEFTTLIKNEGWNLSDDHLQMGLLLVRLRDLFHDVGVAKAAVPFDERKLTHVRKQRSEAFAELFRRLSLAFAVMTFTLMGCAYGTSISRNHSAGRIPVVIALGALYLVGFFLAKEFDSALPLSASLYLAPHALITCLSLRQFRRITAGIE